MVELQNHISNQAVVCGNTLNVPVDLPQAANTDGLAEVDVTGDGGSANVVPVNVLGRKLLGVCKASS